MAKDKVRVNTENNSYFYEVVGTIIIIFGFIILGNLGNFGGILYLFFKFIFGDFSFIIISIIIVIGFRAIIKKKLFNYHSIAFHGFIILMIGLLTLGHLSLYSIMSSDRSIISDTFSLYKSYYQEYKSSYLCGGGFIGAIFFQVFIFFFGKLGTIVLSLALVAIGISFLTNNEFMEIFKRIKYIKKYISKMFSIIKSYFIRIEHPNKPIKKIISNFNLNILSDIKISPNRQVQLEICKEKEALLKDLIKQFSLPIIYDSFNVGYNASTYIFTIISTNNLDLVKNRFFDFFNGGCFFITINNQLLIEVPNRFKELLTLKKVLELTYDDYYLIPVGINSSEDVLTINLKDLNYYLISGDNQSGVRTCLRSIVVSIILKYQNDFILDIIDNKGEFKELSLSSKINYKSGVKESLELLDNICIEIDRRRELLSYLAANSFYEANEQIKNSYKHLELMMPYFLIINSDLSKELSEFTNKLNFITKFSSKMGIYVIVAIRSRNELSDLNINNASKLCFKTESLDLSLKIINSEICTILEGKGDFLYQYNDYLYHGQACYLSTNDYNKVIKKIM